MARRASIMSVFVHEAKKKSDADSDDDKEKDKDDDGPEPDDAPPADDDSAAYADDTGDVPDLDAVGDDEIEDGPGGGDQVSLSMPRDLAKALYDALCDAGLDEGVYEADACPDDGMDEKHIGFDRLAGQLKAKGAKSPGGLAATIGREKYGAAGMAAKARAGRK